MIDRYGRALFIVGCFVAAMASAGERSSFDSGGLTIQYQIDGPADAPPVLLIHGYMASGDINWRVTGMIKLLAPDYRVITIDNRGHGKSDKPTDAESYGAHMADDAVRLLDHLKIEKAHFVGYSMGGMITLNVASRHPERMLSAMIGGMGWYPKGPIRPADAPLGRPTRRPELVACARAFADLGITKEDLAGIKNLPMTVIIGSEDGLLGQRVRPLEAIRPDIPVVIIDGANHINCSFNSDFKNAVKRWLDEQSAKR